MGIEMDEPAPLDHRLPRWAKLNDLVATRTYLQHLGAIAGRIGRSEGLSPDRIPDGRDGAVNGWPLWVWDRAYAEVSA